MPKYKIGQRVRIIKRTSRYFNIEATVIGHRPNARFISGDEGFGYLVDVDGHGTKDIHGRSRGYMECDLTPLTDPDAKAWKEFKKHLQPKPSILLASEPKKETV